MRRKFDGAFRGTQARTSWFGWRRLSREARCTRRGVKCVLGEVEGPVRAGEVRQAVGDGGAQECRDGRLAQGETDSAEQCDVMRAVDGVCDAQGANECANRRVVEIGGGQPGWQTIAEPGTQRGQADVGFEAAAACIGADGRLTRVGFERDVDLAEVSRGAGVDEELAAVVEDAAADAGAQ